MSIKQLIQSKLGKSKSILMIIIACSAALTLLTAYALVPLQSTVVAQAPPVPLDPLTIPKFVNQLTSPPPVYEQAAPNEYSIDMVENMQQVLPPGFPMTKVWGYGGLAKDAVTGAPLGYVANSPGPTFEATKGIPIRVTWNNLITTPLQFAVDPTLHWANPNNVPMPNAPFDPFPPGYASAQSPVPLVTHLHGGEVPPVSDGGPDAWWTNSGIQGPGYSSAVPTSPDSAVYDYPNINPASTLWYHDHA
ncbi:MAG: hypothetical protein NWE84_05395, partial [Candidatus Bathyarchaeota archaeon]|nr:hypothetical protein [Candidatus Bathyarchaeota archaeon]